MREEDYFAPAVDNGDHKPLWDVRAAHKFLEKLLTGAEPIYVPMHNWGDLPKIARSLQISPGTILSFLERGKVQRVGRHMTREGYRAILVTHDEIERLLNRPDATGLSIELFARQCGLKPSAAMRLVREAHIPSTEGRHPKSGVPQRFLAPADIAAFHDRFVTLRGLAVELGLSWQALRPKLADAGVELFSPDGQDYGALFERGAVNAVQLAASAKQGPPKKKDDNT